LTAVSAVIPNRDGADLLRHTLPPLFAELASGEHEVLVIDGASEDDSLGMLRSEFPQVRAVPLRENVGFGAACNLGFTEARLDLLSLVWIGKLVGRAFLPATGHWRARMPAPRVRSLFPKIHETQ